MRKEPFLLALLLGTSACCCMDKHTNRELLEISRETRTELAREFGEVIKKEYPPLGCVLFLKKSTPFGSRLYEALKERGYQLTDTPLQGATPVTYIVDSLGEGLGLTTVSLGDTVRISRSFSLRDPSFKSASITIERRQLY